MDLLSATLLLPFVHKGLERGLDRQTQGLPIREHLANYVGFAALRIIQIANKGCSIGEEQVTDLRLRSLPIDRVSRRRHEVYR